MKSVRISLDTARGLMGVCNLYDVNNSASRALEAAIAASKPKKFVKAAKARRAKKKRSKREETAEIRDLVLERADGFCESCEINFDPDLRPGELDHFWGRGKEKQSVENCWALCRGCHRSKTDNNPTRGYWLAHFGNHAKRHGYKDQWLRVNREIEVAFQIESASQLSRGEAKDDVARWQGEVADNA